MNENTDSVLVALAKALEKLPVYTVEFVAGTLIAVCTDFSITSLTLGCVALWLATNLWWAIAIFFILIVLCRVVNSISNAIGVTGQNLSVALRSSQAIPSMQPVMPSTGRTVVLSENDEAHS